jgi:hypothetical protein
MAKFIRYALATVFFAASVGCLGLWGIGESRNTLYEVLPLSNEKLTFEVSSGMAFVGRVPMSTRRSGAQLYFFNVGDEARVEKLGFPYDESQKMGIFGVISPFCYFPLWYPTLIFGLAGVGVLRFSRQFSIRSALVATTVIAALIGMAVIL